MEDVKLEIGEALSVLRKRSKMTQRELAEMLGVSSWWVGAVESGATQPTYLQVKAWRSITGEGNES